jgi:hypothetical protein
MMNNIYNIIKINYSCQKPKKTNYEKDFMVNINKYYYNIYYALFNYNSIIKFDTIYFYS